MGSNFSLVTTENTYTNAVDCAAGTITFTLLSLCGPQSFLFQNLNFSLWYNDYKNVQTPPDHMTFNTYNGPSTQAVLWGA